MDVSLVTAICWPSTRVPSDMVTPSAAMGVPSYVLSADGDNNARCRFVTDSRALLQEMV